MSYSGKFHPKNTTKYLGDPKNIVYRSSWEKRFFVYCDEHTNIVRWGSEEFHIPYVSPVDGRVHRYFPDVWMEVKTNAGTLRRIVVEIKPKSQSVMPAKRKQTRKYLMEVKTVAVNHAKWQAAREFCQAKGWEFLVLTENELFGKR